MALSRRVLRFRPPAVAAVFVLSAAALVSVVTGCGSAQQTTAKEETATTTAPRSTAANGGEGAVAADRHGGGEESAGPADSQSGNRDRIARDGSSSRKEGSGPVTGTGGSVDPKADRGAAGVSRRCPSGAKRAECANRIRAQAETEGAASYPVTAPSDCLDAMSEARCEEIIAAQKEAEQEGGASIDPETCVEDHSRDYCAARLGEHFEQQQAAQQAGQ